MRYSILVAIAALLLIAPAAAAAPVKAKPVYSVTAAAVSGVKVKFTLAVTLQKIAGCKGSVGASVKLSKKKTVKWSGKLKASDIACVAAIKGSLPAAKFGKKVKFSIKFPGNKVIKKFSATKSLTLSPPAPAGPNGGGGGTTPPGIVGPQKPGLWFMFDATPGSDDLGMAFELRADLTVATMTRPEGLKMVCTPGGNTSVPFNWNNLSFAMGAPSGVVTSGDSNVHTENMVYTLNYNFTGPHAGTGQFSAAGGYRPINPGPFHPCATSYPVTLTGGTP